MRKVYNRFIHTLTGEAFHFIKYQSVQVVAFFCAQLLKTNKREEEKKNPVGEWVVKAVPRRFGNGQGKSR